MDSSVLAEKIGPDHGMTKTDGHTLIEALLVAVLDASAAGEKSSLSGLWQLKVKRVASQDVRSQATGEAIRIKVSARLTFPTARAVKDRLRS